MYYVDEKSFRPTRRTNRESCVPPQRFLRCVCDHLVMRIGSEIWNALSHEILSSSFTILSQTESLIIIDFLIFTRFGTYPNSECHKLTKEYNIISILRSDRLKSTSVTRYSYHENYHENHNFVSCCHPFIKDIILHTSFFLG